MILDVQQLKVNARKKWRWENYPTKLQEGLPPTKKERQALARELSSQLNEWQEKLHAEGQRKVLVVLQGMDTSGKDGTIRSVFQNVDPLGVRVEAFKSPTSTELARDYLWRVHHVVPKSGEMVIFNRSHYEDVLVTRVKGWIDAEEETQRIRHINEFERMLSETGTEIIKIFLNISKETQRERLQQRLDVPEKNWKFAMSDIEDRHLWSAFQNQYAHILSKTATLHAPWYVIPADSKSGRDVMVLQILLAHLQAMNPQFPQVDRALWPQTIY